MLGIDIYSRTFFVLSTTFINTFVSWGLSIPYLFLDIYRKPEFLQQYKIQKVYPILNNSKCNHIRLIKTAKLVLCNQLIVTPMVSYFLYDIINYNNYISLYTILRDIVISTLMVEIFFYYSHRILHLPIFYRTIHSIHHEYTAPVAISALYSHPIEYIFSNIIPVFIGPYLCGSHIYTILLWETIAILNTTIVHSGYNFLFLIDSNKHDIHHSSYKYNFGVLNILDKIHGTLK